MMYIILPEMRKVDADDLSPWKMAVIAHIFKEVSA
jgi:hypothetical protein